MQFVAILPVRDEADIVGQCLAKMLEWADAIYIFDTGSADDTWEIVQAAAAADRRVKPLKKDHVYFSETKLRGWIFHQARQQMRDGDWFLRVDADEFHHIPPPEFVRMRLKRHETIVYHQYFNFALLESEVRNWEVGLETLADRTRPIEDRRRWFTPSDYSEPRLCKYRRTMQWPPTVSFPINAGYVARCRLPIRHYPHRDPQQLDRRCRLRAVMMADAQNRALWKIPFHYWEEAEWRQFVTPDDKEGLQFWKPGSELPDIEYSSHLAKPHVRVAQRLVHKFLLPILDRRRLGWPAEAYPQRIPADIVANLEAILSEGGVSVGQSTLNANDAPPSSNAL